MVVAKFGATLGCSGCVGLGLHTEACRARLEKALVDGAGVGPIATPAAEPQHPQHQRHPFPPSQCHRKVPKRTSRLGNGDGRTGTQGAQDRAAQRDVARDGPVVKAKPAMAPTFVSAAEGSGTSVFSARASSSTDDMMIGGLYVVDGLDVVATLVLQVDAWVVPAVSPASSDAPVHELSRTARPMSASVASSKAGIPLPRRASMGPRGLLAFLTTRRARLIGTHGGSAGSAARWMVVTSPVMMSSGLVTQASVAKFPVKLVAKFDETDGSLDSEHEEECFERWHDDYLWL